MKMVAAALWYRNQGRSPIPVGKDKKPLVKWKQFQKESPTEKQIKQWWTKWPDAGIALATGKHTGITVIDFDSEDALAEAMKHLPPDFNTPCVRTPRGGEHWWLQYDERLPQGANIGLKGLDIRNDGGYIIVPPSPGPNGQKYEWIGNQKFTKVPLSAVPINLYNKLFSFYRGHDDNENADDIKSHQRSSNVIISFDKGNRDQTLFHIANCLVKGGMPEVNIQDCLKFLAQHCNPPFPKKEIHSKIQSALDRSENTTKGLTQDIRDFVMSSDHIITSSFVYQCHQLSSRKEKQIANNVLHRMVKEGILEKVPDRVATFRVVDKTCDTIDWDSASSSEHSIWLPLDILDQVKILPRNIIVFAGEPDVGKTAFCLNIAEQNLHRHSIHYFSSEMGAVELLSRLKDSEVPRDVWKNKVNFWERSSNFEDVIRPDAVNIIDYLEELEEPYKVAARLKRIHDKLKSGIAVIAMQKPKGRDEAAGGHRTLDKPRLYCSISRRGMENRLKIVKGKNRRNPTMNPNGLVRKFKLVQGIRIIPDGLWARELK